MKNHIFSSLVSITKGIHRENRSEKEFQLLVSDLNEINTDNALFKINFKRALNFKKEYFRKLIYNHTSSTITSFKDNFPENATIAENKYTYTILNNTLNKYLNDIANYIKERKISNDILNDNNYIINYLKLSVVQLYLELQEQYSSYTTLPKYDFSEIMEKYFNETNIDINQLEKINKLKPIRKAKITTLKTSFGFKNRDTKKLFNVLDRLHLSLDFLEHRTTTEHFHNLLIAKNFQNTSKNIYLQCETTQFSHIVKALKPYFSNLNPTTIERSGKFYTKTGTLLKANNLHKNTVHNPKEKETIDNIINQLQ